MKKSEDITFLMVGCQRCGTTWVDAALREHPEIYLPQQKQSYFFDRNYDRGMDWYLRNFEGVNTEHKAVGEVATGYSLPGAVPGTRVPVASWWTRTGSVCRSSALIVGPRRFPFRHGTWSARRSSTAIGER